MAAVVKIFTAALSLSDLVKSSKDFSLLSFLLEAYLIPVVAKIYAGTPIIPPANAVTGASIPFKAPVAKFLKFQRFYTWDELAIKRYENYRYMLGNGSKYCPAPYKKGVFFSRRKVKK